MAIVDVIIYNVAKANQQKELAFLEWLTKQFVNSKVIRENFVLDALLAYNTLKPLAIAKSIQNNQHLSLGKKSKCICELTQLPNEIKIVRTISEITVDFTLIVDSKIHFIEFHEKQHCIDSNKRLNNVYTIDGEEIKVPRYLQRLLRDIWRAKYLPNYKIVWHDWFDKHKYNILNSDKTEFALSDRFKLSDLIH